MPLLLYALPSDLMGFSKAHQKWLTITVLNAIQEVFVIMTITEEQQHNSATWM